MSDTALVVQEDLISDLNQLKLQLEQAKMRHRNASFKFTREQRVLKRVIAKLSETCLGYHDELDKCVLTLKTALEQQHDISRLLPHMAVLERLLKKNTYKMEKQKSHLDERVRQSGETLQRIPGLPAQLKRDLRNLLSFPSIKNNKQLDNAIRLLGIYERAIKIIMSNSAHTLNHGMAGISKELQNRLSEELQSLINELDFSGESGDLLADIRIKLLSGINFEELIDITLQILKLVIQGTHFERKTSEQFLNNVNDSLSGAIKINNQCLEQSASYAGHRREMHQELTSLASTSQDYLHKATSIEEAKAATKPLFEQIAMLTERLQHNEQRELALLDRMRYSKNQLEALFELTHDYRRRLEDQSQRMQLDPLTKVLHRTAFMEYLETEYHRWIRAQHPLHIILLDMDNFKSINDSFGYSAGDKALKIIARTLTNVMREQDILARFSGEEFIAILPDINQPTCQTLLNTLQGTINKLPFKFREQSITVGVSISASTFKDSDTPEEVMERLNLGLKEAKQKGYNQIVWK
ncbi:GGDEF domain-containing protein [Vibrio sp. HA2012]|uniref:GGDEF domain-containing protein n=1 Tax=Vibrio sp. HA2012 TaxID=1971595 RepID=UPI000C2C74CF|nr:GGDEF domain-containing protein [Vibrio sp. HA2012]PJC86519.1 GGDEF domain-containing protein [Vibrio sp. HA2012]